jgi:hypothetical protein
MITEISKEPNSDIWPKIIEIADNHKELLALAFVKYVKDKIKRIDDDSILNVLTIGSTDDIIKFIGLNDDFGLNKIANKITSNIIETINNEYGWKIDVKDREIHRYIDNWVASRVVEVNDETINCIKNLVNDAHVKGLNAIELRNNIKSNIGLTHDQEGWVRNYWQRTWLSTPIEDFKDLDAKTAYVNKLTERYRKRVLNYRAMNIARTETINMVNEASWKYYDEAANRNIIIRDEFELVWIVTPDDRLCDKCRPLANMTCPIGGTFRNGKKCPGEHPQCRCCVICRRKR